jgi:hypothetical protein
MVEKRHRKYVNITETVDVDVYIEEFDDDVLVQEIFDRELQDRCAPDISSNSDEQLIQELEGRGFAVARNGTDLESKIQDLFYDYVDGRPLDHARMKAFFYSTINERIL